jgi:hypothetical protein
MFSEIEGYLVKRFKELVFVLIFLILFLRPSYLYSQPGWLKKGDYAVYRFKHAYASNGPLVWGDFGWELIDLGEGYYRWEVLSIEGNLATLEVTFSSSNGTETAEVVINTETMDLIEDGKVWGKAWLWIDLTALPAPSDVYTVERNIILVASWLNETVKNPRVSKVHSMSKEENLPPIKTGLGSVDLVVVVSTQTNVTNLKLGGVVHQDPSGEPLDGCYEAQCGLLVAGLYVDDILTQKFGVYYFENLGRVGEAIYWMYLEDTNVDIGISAEGTDITVLLKTYFPYILLGVLVVLFIITLVRSWRRTVV